jgi:hypothetical protein
MKRLSIAIAIYLFGGAANAQGPMPLTDWRAMLDNDLAKLSMPRDAHQAIFNILQLYERRAQQAERLPDETSREGLSEERRNRLRNAFPRRPLRDPNRVMPDNSQPPVAPATPSKPSEPELR